MNRKMYILFFILPTIQGLAAFFKSKDINNTGLDDIIAGQLESLVVNLQTWVNTPEPSIEPNPQTFHSPNLK